MSFNKPLIYGNKTHRPVVDGEYLTTGSMPISERGGNQLVRTEDGMYAGQYLAQTVYYVSAGGTDRPDYGTKTQPFKTLDYAMDFVTAATVNMIPPGPVPEGGLFTGTVTIALKAGETFKLSRFYAVRGSLTFAFWGDPQYGDFNGPLIPTAGAGASGASPAVMSDLQRPIIQPQVVNVTDGIGCLASTLGSLDLRLIGVKVDLPTATTGKGDFCNFVVATVGSSVNLELYGAIINRSDTASVYGLLGMHARANINTLRQFASQFTYNWAPILGGAPSDVLLSRANWIRFYKDFPGNIQSNGSVNNPTDGTSILNVTWSDTPELPVQPGKNNLPTYPLCSDVALGLRNYFTNLTRDPSARPLNVVCGRQL